MLASAWVYDRKCGLTCTNVSSEPSSGAADRRIDEEVPGHDPATAGRRGDMLHSGTGE